jgi:Ca2+-binding EF-hand superfamily protein
MRKFLLIGGAAVVALGTANAAMAQIGPGGGPGMRADGMRGGHERMFERADADRDGRVTREEMRTAARERFDRVDANRDGAVTLEEWQAYAATEWGRRGGDERVTQRRAAMFRGADQNSDGRLSFEEALVMPEAMFRAADVNADGAVAREELPTRHARGHGHR